MAQKADANGMLHGTLDALILKTLTWGARHGYGIARWIEETTDDAVVVEEGSLYPALYRMERRGWIEAEWGTSELGRKAKFYRITAEGPAPARGRHRAVGAASRPASRRCSCPRHDASASGCARGFWRAARRRRGRRRARLPRRDAHARARRARACARTRRARRRSRRFGDINRVNATCRALGRQRDQRHATHRVLCRARAGRRPSPAGSCCRSPGFTIVAVAHARARHRRDDARSSAPCTPSCCGRCRSRSRIASSRSTRSCASNRGNVSAGNFVDGIEPVARASATSRRPSSISSFNRRRRRRRRARRRRAGRPPASSTSSACRRHAAASSRPRKISPGASRSSCSAIGSGRAGSAAIRPSSAVRSR